MYRDRNEIILPGRDRRYAKHTSHTRHSLAIVCADTEHENALLGAGCTLLDLLRVDSVRVATRSALLIREIVLFNWFFVTMLLHSSVIRAMVNQLLRLFPLQMTNWTKIFPRCLCRKHRLRFNRPGVKQIRSVAEEEGDELVCNQMDSKFNPDRNQRATWTRPCRRTLRCGRRTSFSETPMRTCSPGRRPPPHWDHARCASAAPLAAPAFALKILRGLGFGFRGVGLEFGVLGSKFRGWVLGFEF